MKRGRRMTAAARKEQIVWVLENSPDPLFVSEIAERIGLKRSPYLNFLIAALVDEGRISWDWGNLWNGAVGRVYFPTLPKRDGA